VIALAGVVATASKYLLPLVAVGGVLLLRKVARYRVAGLFRGVFLAANVFLSVINGMPVDMILRSLGSVFGQSPVVFAT